MIFLYNMGANLVSFLVLSRYGVINLSFYVVSHTESRGGRSHKLYAEVLLAQGGTEV